LGGIAGPALQGLMSNEVPANEQGELQGAITSMMSATSIIGPPVMTGLFAYYTATTNEFQFAGAPLLLAAFLSIIGLLWSMKVLSKMKKG
jgi:DHA1 family tetracycline resistance protein-like MFS transporter